MGELDAEKMKTEKAFHDFLPTSVVRDMKRRKVTWSGVPRVVSEMSQQAGEGSVLAEQFDCVTIFYGEIIGFTALISDCSASEVIIIIIFISPELHTAQELRFTQLFGSTNYC